MTPRVLFVGRNHYRLPLDASLARKWDALEAELDLRVLATVDRPQMEWHRANVATLIERDRSYLEVYKTDGTPYRGRAFLYQADEGMIWASMFLDLYA